MASSLSFPSPPLVPPVSSTLFRPIPNSRIWRPLLLPSPPSPSLSPSPTLSNSSSSSSTSIPPTAHLHFPPPPVYCHPPPALPTHLPQQPQPQPQPIPPPIQALPDRRLSHPNLPLPLPHRPPTPPPISTSRKSRSARPFPTTTTTHFPHPQHPHPSSPNLFRDPPSARLNKPNFFARVFRRLRPTRSRDRFPPHVTHPLHPVGRPPAPVPQPPTLAPASAHVHFHDSSDDGWSSAELRFYTAMNRECGSFSIAGRDSRRRTEWGRVARRRTMNMDGLQEEGGGMLRVCRTSVSLVKDKDKKKRLGRREDRRVDVAVDRTDRVSRRKRWRPHACRTNDDMLRNRVNALGGSGCEVNSRCNSDPVMFRCGKSFQSSNSSVALSVSTVTQASHSSS